jgi:hypothetical protein
MRKGHLRGKKIGLWDAPLAHASCVGANAPVRGGSAEKALQPWGVPDEIFSLSLRNCLNLIELSMDSVCVPSVVRGDVENFKNCKYNCTCDFKHDG